MIKLIIKYKNLFLVIVITITAMALLQMKSLYFNTEFSQFLPEDDPEYVFYKQINSEIPDEEHMLVVGISNKGSIFDYDFLQKVNHFSDSLKNIPHVKKVRGLINLSYPYKTILGIVPVKYINIQDNANIISYKKKIFEDFEFTQHFINREGTTLFYYVEIEKGLTNDQYDNLLKKIADLRSLDSDLKTYLIGKKYLESSFKNILSNEITSFVLWFLLFLIFSLMTIFRNFLAVVFPIILVFVSLVIFFGTMAFFNRPLGVMANLFPVIILIVGISDVVHMAFKYNLERTGDKKIKDATTQTLKEIGWTTFITSFTTAIGFFVLYTAPMKAMRDFGLEAGFAVLLVYVVTLLIAPSFFIYSKKITSFSPNKYFDIFSKKLIEKIEWLHQYPKGIIGVYLVLLVIATFGVFSINTNNLRFSNIPDNTELKENYTFFEKSTGGSRTFELVVLAKNDYKLNTPEFLKSGLEIQQYLESLSYLNKVISPLLYYKALHRTFEPTKSKFSPIPTDEKTILKYERQFNLLGSENYLFNKEHTIYKFKSRMKDLGRNSIASRNKEILQNVNSLIDQSKVTVRISGVDFLIDRANEERINNILFGLMIAIIVVAITLGAIYKNIALILITLVLNFIPIFIVAGIMGFTNLELRGATSIIFTVGFVIAVDDTIHMLSKFQWELKKGECLQNAISNALHECGKAILATSILLIGGFAILMLSDFIEIFTLGLLVGLIVLITLSVDFILAPILLSMCFKKNDDNETN